ncbi:FixH family protein [Mycobacterium sp. NPDC003449]
MSRRNLVVVFVAAAVLAAVLWLFWPTSTATHHPAATAGPYLVRLTGESPSVGVHPLTVEITGSAGETPQPDSVSFEPAMPQMGHATPPVAASPDGADRYRGDVDLSMPGQWEITVRIASGTQTYDAVLSVTTNG